MKTLAIELQVQHVPDDMTEPKVREILDTVLDIGFSLMDEVGITCPLKADSFYIKPASTS